MVLKMTNSMMVSPNEMPDYLLTEQNDANSESVSSLDNNCEVSVPSLETKENSSAGETGISFEAHHENNASMNCSLVTSSSLSSSPEYVIIPNIKTEPLDETDFDEDDTVLWSEMQPSSLTVDHSYGKTYPKIPSLQWYSQDPSQSQVDTVTMIKTESTMKNFVPLFNNLLNWTKDHVSPDASKLYDADIKTDETDPTDAASLSVCDSNSNQDLIPTGEDVCQVLERTIKEELITEEFDYTCDKVIKKEENNLDWQEEETATKYNFFMEPEMNGNIILPFVTRKCTRSESLLFSCNDMSESWFSCTDKYKSLVRVRETASQHRRQNSQMILNHTRIVIKLPYRCDKCKRKFKTESELSDHLHSVHSTDSPFCVRCGTKFKNEGNLLKHIRTVHSSKRPHSCQECEKAFKVKSSLAEHIKLVHLQDRPFLCDLCGKTFKSKSHLSGHFRVHNGQRPQERLFLCDMCGKTFKYKTHLIVHLRVHNGEMPLERSFLCDFCGKIFRSSSHLSVHLCKHTNGMKKPPQERPFLCDICGKTFKSKAHLRVHFRVHSSERPHSCSRCIKSFKTNSELSRHMQYVHIGARPHACVECQMGFKSKTDLAKHISSVHNTERPYFCDVCGTEFESKSVLSAHLRYGHR